MKKLIIKKFIFLCFILILNCFACSNTKESIQDVKIDEEINEYLEIHIDLNKPVKIQSKSYTGNLDDLRKKLKKEK